MSKNSSKNSQPQRFGLFVFLVLDKVDFWIYANARFHRFLYLNGRYRWIRSQAVLPAGASGTCVTFSAQQKRRLETEAQKCGITLVFYTDLLACILAASQEPCSGGVIGMAHPAGCLTAEGFVEITLAPDDDSGLGRIHPEATQSRRKSSIPGRFLNFWK